MFLLADHYVPDKLNKYSQNPSHLIIHQTFLKHKMQELKIGSNSWSWMHLQQSLTNPKPSFLYHNTFTEQVNIVLNSKTKKTVWRIHHVEFMEQPVSVSNNIVDYQEQNLSGLWLMHKIVFHKGGGQLRLSSIEVVFNWGHLPLRSSSIEAHSKQYRLQCTQ